MSEWVKPKVHITECGCGHDRDHNVVFTFAQDPDYGDELYVSAGLNHFRGFWARLAIAFKYALGIDNTYYAYTESMLSKAEAKRLRNYLSDVVEQFEEGKHPLEPKQPGPKTELVDIEDAADATWVSSVSGRGWYPDPDATYPD